MSVLFQTMMLNDRIRSLDALQGALRKAEKHLAGITADTPYSEFHHRYCTIVMQCLTK
jgi:sucrose synthase